MGRARIVTWQGALTPVDRIDVDAVEVNETAGTFGFGLTDQEDFGTQVDIWFDLDTIGTARTWGGDLVQLFPTPLGLTMSTLELPQSAADNGEPWVIADINEEVADGSILWTSHEAREFAAALIAAADAADLTAGQE